LLDGHEFHLATVLKYIPGQKSNDALVAKLNSPISCKSIAGGTIVLEIRHQCEKWMEGGIVHIELCDFIPENLEWSKWKQGVWIEAAASYKVIDNV
jgi:hypothetical protein